MKNSLSPGEREDEEEPYGSVLNTHRRDDETYAEVSQARHACLNISGSRPSRMRFLNDFRSRRARARAHARRCPIRFIHPYTRKHVVRARTPATHTHTGR